MVQASVRRAVLNDVPSVAPLFDAYRQFYEMPPDLSRASEYLEARLRLGESVIFLAEDETKQAIGSCQLYFSFCSVFNARICILNDLFVTPAARGSGAGRALLAEAERHAAEAGSVRIVLQTARTNVQAQSLYESAGWAQNTVFFGYGKRLAVTGS
jgi:ribosomal protein S18 acetylase RimI-like enzyme